MLVSGIFNKVPVCFEVAHPNSTSARKLVQKEDVDVLRNAAPKMMEWIEECDEVLADMFLGDDTPDVKGAADAVYFHRCVVWLKKKGVYAKFERECIGVMRIILHQLWVPIPQVLFALGLCRAYCNTPMDPKSATPMDPKSALSLVLPMMPESLQKANAEGRGIATHPVFWLLRRCLVPGNITHSQDQITTGPWLCAQWVENEPTWQKLRAAGAAHKQLYDATLRLLESGCVGGPGKKELAALELSHAATRTAFLKITAIGCYLGSHCNRIMLSREIGTDKTATLLGLCPSWHYQNKSGEKQKQAYKELCLLYSASGKGDPTAHTFLNDIRLVLHTLGSTTSCQLNKGGQFDGAGMSGQLDKCGQIDAGCFLCEVFAVKNYLAVKRRVKWISVSEAIEMWTGLNEDTAGPYYELRVEIISAGGLATWAHNRLIASVSTN